jgi:hypothetical protein
LLRVATGDLLGCLKPHVRRIALGALSLFPESANLQHRLKLLESEGKIAETVLHD